MENKETTINKGLETERNGKNGIGEGKGEWEKREGTVEIQPLSNQLPQNDRNASLILS
jgi:hypothetical protein